MILISTCIMLHLIHTSPCFCTEPCWRQIAAASCSRFRWFPFLHPYISLDPKLRIRPWFWAQLSIQAVNSPSTPVTNLLRWQKHSPNEHQFSQSCVNWPAHSPSRKYSDPFTSCSLLCRRFHCNTTKTKPEICHLLKPSGPLLWLCILFLLSIFKMCLDLIRVNLWQIVCMNLMCIR